jgi:hypothetical protein
MREHQLPAPPYLRLKAKRTPQGSEPTPTTPNGWWGIALTKALVEGGSWVSSVVVRDWSTRAVVGHDAGLRDAGDSSSVHPWQQPERPCGPSKRRGEEESRSGMQGDP